MKLIKPFAALFLLSLLAGCAVGPNYKPPPVKVPAAFTGAGQGGFEATNTVAAWWRGFDDDKLNELVARAIASNLDLRVAAANLRLARALRSGSAADFLPAANAVGSYQDVRYSQTALFSAPGVSREQSLWNAGFDASWELDLFGRVRRSYQANSAAAEAVEAGLRFTQVSVISEVARNYFDWRGAQNELGVLRHNAANQADTLKITQARLEAGAGTELDVARARAQWNHTLASIPPVESAAAHAAHRLAVLVGQLPEGFAAELPGSSYSVTTPPLVAIGNPEQLLRRRPDVQAAERRLAAATALIGVSVADLFPRVTFNGAIGLEATHFSGLGAAGSDDRAFGPSITWAALDLGHVRARINAAGAGADAQLALYQQTVLTSLEETENAMVDYGRERARVDFLAESVKASEEAARLAHDRYDNGATDFLSVLDAERTLLEAQDELAQTQTRTVDALIAVYKALGGGWEQ